MRPVSSGVSRNVVPKGDNSMGHGLPSVDQYGGQEPPRSARMGSQRGPGARLAPLSGQAPRPPPEVGQVVQNQPHYASVAVNNNAVLFPGPDDGLSVGAGIGRQGRGKELPPPRSAGGPGIGGLASARGAPRGSTEHQDPSSGSQTARPMNQTQHVWSQGRAHASQISQALSQHNGAMQGMQANQIQKSPMEIPSHAGTSQGSKMGSAAASHRGQMQGGDMSTSVIKTGKLSPRPQGGGNLSPRPASKGGPGLQGLSGGPRRPSNSNSGGEQSQPSAKEILELPLTPAKVLKNRMDQLTDFEQGEILDFPQVYFWGGGAEKIRGTSSSTNNHGYDDERGDYQVVLNDHILYRYEVTNPLGKGSFGQVIRAKDYKNDGTFVALKIIRNKKRFHHQALVEVRILEQLRDRDMDNNSNVVHVQDYFYFRNHLCITFELLSINLYEFIKNNNFQGVSLGLIRRFAIQLLTALRFLRKQRVIHCDLKPENVLLKNPTKSGIKVIDFGSSCLEDERVYTYIQSRFYRAPEVILGIPYDLAIDMWSFGCILAELCTGYPLFPGENEVEQLLCIMEICGLPPESVLEVATRTKMFFDSKGAPRIAPNSRGKKRRPGTKDLNSCLRTSDSLFVDFLSGCLAWNCKERFIPEDAMRHEWILQCYDNQRQSHPAESAYGQAPSSSSGKRRSHKGKRGSVE